MFRYPLQPYPHIQYPVAAILQENLSDQQLFDEVDYYQNIPEEREPLHVIEKSQDSLKQFLVVGTLLSALITGSLPTMEPHVDCDPVTPGLGGRAGLVMRVDTGDLGLGLLCTATSNKLATVLAAVWLPIITFCLLRYHKTETLNPETQIIHQVFVK